MIRVIWRDFGWAVVREAPLYASLGKALDAAVTLERETGDDIHIVCPRCHERIAGDHFWQEVTDDTGMRSMVHNDCARAIADGLGVALDAILVKPAGVA